MPTPSKIPVALCLCALLRIAPAVAQQYPQPAANQLMSLTGIGLAAQLCGVPMTDATKKKLADGLERLGNSQTDLNEQQYHKAVEDMAQAISGDLEHACIQINNQDVPTLIDKVLGQ
jgi:hypothetical protein